MGSLKEALLECLHGSLSPEGSIRKSAEERLKALEVTENYPIFLMDVILDNSVNCEPPPVRQLACVVLRQYVVCHWTSIAEKFVPPEPSDQVKAALREKLPLGLCHPESKIRNALATTISTIAKWDWPECWPNLFDVLLVYLQKEESVSGAMRVLVEFVNELTEEHMKQISPIILPQMCAMIENSGFCSYTRARAVQVFRICMRVIHVFTQKKETLKTLEPMIQSYVAAFLKALEEPPTAGHLKLKKEIIKTIATLVRNYQAKITPSLQQLLPRAWGILTSLAIPFREQLVDNDAEDGNVDSDGEDCGIESVLYVIFELVQSLLDVPKLSKAFVSNGLFDLIYYLIYYMQLPQDRVEEWMSSPSAFICDETEEYATYSVRNSAQDLLTVICSEFEKESIIALEQAVNKYLSTPEGQTDWRLQEACLFAVSTMGPNIVKMTSANILPRVFDVHGFVQNIVIPGMSAQDTLLVGRCLLLGSSFSSIIDPSVAQKFIQATVECLQPDKSIILKVLSTKALDILVEQAMQNSFVKEELLLRMPMAVESLINFGVTGESVEILRIVLETLTNVLQLDTSFTATVGSKVITMSIACFVKFNTDPVLCPIVEGILESLCKNSACVVEVQERLTPTLLSVLNSDKENMGGPQGVALDLLTVIVRSSPQPLGRILTQEAFPAVANIVLRSDDHTVLQNGGECLRAFTSVAPDEICCYRGTNGVSGLNYVVQVACRLLDPTTSEFSASFAGKLVTTLLWKTGDRLGDQLELLLRAVLSKLRSSFSQSVIQNLLMVYAFLFNTQLEAALNFLDGVPGPTGESALQFVMIEWVARQPAMFGLFDRKVTAIALSNILKHGINTEDPRLTGIEVRGELIDTEQMITRSKKKPQQWTRIPLLAKIFKLLVDELSGSLSDISLEEDVDSNSDTDENDEDNDKENDLTLYGKFEDLYEDEESGLNLEDKDILSSPLYSVDLGSYLKDYLSALSQQPCFPAFLNHLNNREKKVLHNLGIIHV